MASEQRSPLESFNTKWLAPLLAIITTVYGFMFKIEHDKLDNLKTRVDTELRQKEFQNNLKLTIYREVKEAIGKRDSSLQNAALLVVNEMLNEDTAFREKLKTLLIASAVSDTLLKTQNKIDEFVTTQNIPQANTQRMRVDVFFLEDVPTESQKCAVKIEDLIHAKFGDYDVRVRLLPREINARSGYRVDANQIRHEQSEEAIAIALKKAINEAGIFDLEPVKLHEVKNATPGYISIFARNR